MLTLQTSKMVFRLTDKLAQLAWKEPDLSSYISNYNKEYFLNAVLGRILGIVLQ